MASSFPVIPPSSETPSESLGDRFLVCGLGRLGQECVVALKRFGVIVVAIAKVPPLEWSLAEVPQLLEELIVGDCRQLAILQQAQVQKCRTVLIVTNDEEVNAQTALAVRQLNPAVRIVVRSAAHNLNQLLSEQLGNFFAGEPTQLTATAFGLAGLGSETLGFFELDGQSVQVISHEIKAEDRWCKTRSLYELNTPKRRLLFHLSAPGSVAPSFHRWKPEHILQPGEIVVYAEAVERFSLTHHRQRDHSRPLSPSSGDIWQWIGHQRQQMIAKMRGWRYSWGVALRTPHHPLRGLLKLQGMRKVALLSGIVIIALLLIGTVLFKSYISNTTWISAFYGTALLLLGDYGELFGTWETLEEISSGLQLFAFSLTVVGTGFVGVLYALLTEALLSSKFELLHRRRPIPQNDHLILVGLDRLGQEVAVFLENLEQALVGITFNPDFDRTLLPDIPIVVGNLREALLKANLLAAKSIIIATDNEMLNLEIALMARTLNPHSHLVMRTYGRGLSRYLTNLLTNVQVVGTDQVAAEAFAGAAFGENIISLFCYHDKTILVTEYQIEEIDTLHGLLVSEVAYGYGVVVILHQTPPQEAVLMPSDDIRLAVGDRIVVLSSIDGLKRIEQGTLQLASRSWYVRVETAATADSVFDGANVIARIAGYSLSQARQLMQGLPQTLPEPLYLHQGERLVRELRRSRVKAQLIPLRHNGER